MIEFTVCVSATLKSIEYIDYVCEKTLKDANFNDYERISFAIHEAVINAIEATKQKYGQESSEKKIEIKIFVSEDEVEVHIIDEADGISEEIWGGLTETSLKDVLMKERGRGLLIIKNFVDKLWQEGGEKHILKFRKGRKKDDGR